METMHSRSRKMGRRWVSSLGLVVLFSTTAQAVELLPTRSYLPLDMAYKAAQAAQDQCTSDGYQVSVSVVDAGGGLLVLLRNPSAGPHTVGSSRGKAFTAVSMGRPTSELAKLIGDKPFLSGLRDMDERLVILGGGLPIVVGGQRVGGIGVGGAPGGHLDDNCARQGLKAIGLEVD